MGFRGQESTRSIWSVYYDNTDAIIYVIDTHDETYDESKTQFYKLLKNETLKNAIILIYANKQDLPGAKNVGEIIKIYELDTIKDHIWHIQPCSAQTGEGLITGMKWLSDQLVFKSNNNFPINPYIDYEQENEESKDDIKEKENNYMNNNINNNINVSKEIINNEENKNENKENNADKNIEENNNVNIQDK